jgi:hypothetical protein
MNFIIREEFICCEQVRATYTLQRAHLSYLLNCDPQQVNMKQKVNFAYKFEEHNVCMLILASSLQLQAS